MKNIVGVCIILFLSFCIAFANEPVKYGMNPQAGRYVQSGDAKIYYEIYGQGEPLMLLHGGLFGYIDEYERIIPELSRNHMVIAVATRGHGKSELGNQPLSYQLLAKDFATVIETIRVESVNVVGFSDGAIVGYHLAVLYPKLVKKLIAVGGPLGPSGSTEEGLKDLNSFDSPEVLNELPAEFVTQRKQLMPNAADWDRFVRSLGKMWNQNEYISKEKIRSIECPVMVAAGDHDEYVKPEHLVEIYRSLQKGQLAVIPNSRHTVFNSNPDLMLKLIRNFLSENLSRY
ncbi:MAG TPA: alpha/beta hydrolase [Acidobacteriota bacterium]|nr:alpha/beta hydrolase [Acidobacteriota bacterium]